MNVLLEVNQINSYYGDSHILFDVSLQVGRNEVVALLGRNGAGKTTMLNTLMGFVRPRSGRILLDGRPIQDLRPHAIAQLGLQLVPESRRIFSSLSVEENLRIGAFARRPGPWTLESVYALFPQLKDKRHAPAPSLSGGQQQMVAIGRALMARPRLLLLDEPSLGLSPLVVADMFGAIRKISASGITIVLVEQNVQQAMRISHRACVLELGRIVAEGAPDELMNQPEIRKAYLGT